jgi:signal transduction histidine kinase
MSIYQISRIHQARWVIAGALLILLPAVILSYYGIRLYLLNRQEREKITQTRALLSEQFPYWKKKVNAYVTNAPDRRITPGEAQELFEKQKTLQGQYLYLTVDSLFAMRNVSQDSVMYSYDYQRISIETKVLSRGAVVWDGMYIVNGKKEFLGQTHNKTGYLLMLQTAMQLLEREQAAGFGHTFFNGNLAINDAIINQRTSIIGLDTTGKYLIQLSSRAPDAGYQNNNNKIAVPQGLYLLFNDFVRVGWLILLATLITMGLFWYILRLSKQSHQWLSSLNKATCAIAISDREGQFHYANQAFNEWNNRQTVQGKNIRECSQHPQLDTIIQKVQTIPGQTEYFYSQLGSKSVHSGMTYDAETESLILVDTDVSALRHMYDGELHSLKNLIQEVKELTGRIVVGEIDIRDVDKTLRILEHNNHTLEKALLFYENRRHILGGGQPHIERLAYDLEIGLENIVHWFESLLHPLHIRVEITAGGLEIYGNIQGIELIFHNAIFNAIQAIKEHHTEGIQPYIRIIASMAGNYVLVEIEDNGKKLPEDQSFEDLVSQSKGMGLPIIKLQIEALGGHCPGFRVINAQTKALQLYFPAV